MGLIKLSVQCMYLSPLFGPLQFNSLEILASQVLQSRFVVYSFATVVSDGCINDSVMVQLMKNNKLQNVQVLLFSFKGGMCVCVCVCVCVID